MRAYLLTGLLVVAALAGYTATPARIVTQQQLLWTRLANNLVIDSAWSVQTEVDNRIFLKPVKENQVVMRIMGRYAHKNYLEAAAGFVSFLNYPNDPLSTSTLMVPELRGATEVILRHRLWVIGFSHRNLFEYRFTHNATATELQPGYRFTFRYRYRIQADVSLLKRKSNTLRLLLSNEIMLQAGKSIVLNPFDQNRVTAALNYEPLRWLGFELGYIHWFQQRSSGDQFYRRHILRFTVFTKIFLPRKNKAA